MLFLRIEPPLKNFLVYHGFWKPVRRLYLEVYEVFHTLHLVSRNSLMPNSIYFVTRKPNISR